VSLLAATAMVSALGVPAVLAARPFNEFGGGGLVNPCNQHLLLYRVDAMARIQGNVTVLTEWGTATDQETGDIYKVTITERVSGEPFVDPVWSSTSTMVFVGQHDTLTVHDMTLTNENPEPPHVIPNSLLYTCGGSGRTQG